MPVFHPDYEATENMCMVRVASCPVVLLISQNSPLSAAPHPLTSLNSNFQPRWDHVAPLVCTALTRIIRTILERCSTTRMAEMIVWSIRRVPRNYP